jgi:hypothetical protein
VESACKWAENTRKSQDRQKAPISSSSGLTPDGTIAQLSRGAELGSHFLRPKSREPSRRMAQPAPFVNANGRTSRRSSRSRPGQERVLPARRPPSLSLSRGWGSALRVGVPRLLEIRALRGLSLCMEAVAQTPAGCLEPLYGRQNPQMPLFVRTQLPLFGTKRCAYPSAVGRRE